MSDQPVNPPANPPGDFAVNSIWTSPSLYLTLATYLLPLLTMIFHRDVSAVVQAIAQAAPGIATVALLIARVLHKNTIIKANAGLAAERMRVTASLQSQHLAMQHEIRVETMRQQPPQVSLLPPAKAAPRKTTPRRR